MSLVIGTKEPVTLEKAGEAADALEKAIQEVLDQSRKAGDMPLGPIAYLIAFVRQQSGERERWEQHIKMERSMQQRGQ